MESKPTKFNVHEWLEKPLKRTPGKKYLSDGEADLSYSTLADSGLPTPYSNPTNNLSKVPHPKFMQDYEVNIEPMLFPQTTIPEYFMDNFEKANLASQGVTKQAFEHFKQKVHLDYNQISALLGVARNTLINKKGTDVFDVYISEKLIAVAEVYTHGFSVFEDEEKWNRWVHLPNRALGGATPFSLLGTQYGRQEVHNVLGRIEWGVYS